jgi:hypothetical protein
LQDVIKYKFLTTVQTGDPMLDGLFHMIIYTSMAGIFGYGSSLLPSMTFQMKRLFWILYNKLKWYKPKVTKNIQIDYITDNKQINELHKAVSWYLSNNNLIDFDQETPLKFVYDKQISKDFGPINKIIVNHEWKMLKYKNEEISYYLTNNLITIYGDKEKKRENYSIYLQASNNKILDDFCQLCMKEYAINIHGNVWAQKIYINNKGQWENSVSNNRRRLQTIALKEGQLEDLLGDLESFIKTEDWYHDHDILEVIYCMVDLALERLLLLKVYQIIAKDIYII